jgi:hypothetical protein
MCSWLDLHVAGVELPLRLHDGDIVAENGVVGGYEHCALDACLRQKEPIEWIAVMVRK